MEATALAWCPRLSDLGKLILPPCSVSEPWPDLENTMTVWLVALLRSEPYLKWQHCKLVFEGFNMTKNTALPLSYGSNFIQAPQVVSDTSEKGQPSENLLSIERAWHSISA